MAGEDVGATTMTGVGVDQSLPVVREHTDKEKKKSK